MAGIFACLVATASPAETKQNTSSTPAKEVWAVGSQDGFPPFNYTFNGRYTGIDVDIINEAAASIGVILEHKPMPWKRALLGLETGSLDVAFQLAPTPERFEKWHMIGPFRSTRTVFMTLVDSPLSDITDVSQLDGLIVGVVDGFSYQTAFDANPDIDREASPDDFTNVRKLLLGRSDVIVGGYATLAYVASELNARDEVRFIPTPLAVRSRYIGMRRDKAGTERAQRLQQALDEMKSSGRLLESIQA
jgi:polar amino acid transport system substrate-binding protein